MSMSCLSAIFRRAPVEPQPEEQVKDNRCALDCCADSEEVYQEFQKCAEQYSATQTGAPRQDMVDSDSDAASVASSSSGAGW